MEKNNFYIEAEYDGNNIKSFASMGEFVECSKCKRKIMVCMGLIGTVHHMGTSATCAECTEITDEFRSKFPDIAKQIDEWKNES